MDPFGSNPFAVLTFIVAPAVLTNASSVLGLQTANRFARSVDRARALAAQLDGAAPPLDTENAFRLRQLDYAERRVLILVRALTAFYVSVGGFAAASFFSLLGAIFVILRETVPLYVALSLALVAGVIAVVGLLTGSALVVWETRHTHRILREETRIARERRTRVLPADGKPPGL
jgi:hypothetical protein